MRSILALISSAFLTTSLLSTSVVAHPSPASSGPSKGSEFALECALGFGPSTCAKKIPNACYVKSADYLGRNAGGADIYEVHYLHENRAYGVAPDPDGKASHYLIVETDPYWVKRTISSPAAPILIYSRPENSPADYAGECGMGGTV